MRDPNKVPLPIKINEYAVGNTRPLNCEFFFYIASKKNACT